MSSNPASGPFEVAIQKSRRYTEYIDKLIAADDKDETFEGRMKSHQALIEIAEKLDLEVDDAYRLKDIVCCPPEGLDRLR